MQDNQSNKPRDKTLKWVFVICFVISFLQNVIIERGINALIIGQIIGTFIAMIAITGIVGVIANLLLRSKKGYWIGLIAAVGVDILSFILL